MYGVHLGWLLSQRPRARRAVQLTQEPPECALFRVWPPAKAGKVRSGFERQISIQAIQFAAVLSQVITTLKAMGGREGRVVLAGRVGRDELHRGGQQ